MAYQRITHDEWWVVTNYGGDWLLECRCMTEEDAKKILKEYKNLPGVVDSGIKKVQVYNHGRDEFDN